MFIAFEGPDNVGKSHDAATLATDGVAVYNVSKALYGQAHDLALAGDVVTFDRIDWFSHLVYRLGMPDHEWNDAAVRTVFAMPDTHLVIKVHHPDTAGLISDELYEEGKVAQVNPMYLYFAQFMIDLNLSRDYALFRSISVVEVRNNPAEGSFTQRLVAFDAPTFKFLDVLTMTDRLITDEFDLLEMLRSVDKQLS